MGVYETETAVFFCASRVEGGKGGQKGLAVGIRYEAHPSECDLGW